MFDGEKILSRVTPLGLAFLLVGAVLCYGAKPIVKRVFKTDNEKTVHIIKLTGLVLAAAAALSIMKII